MTCMANRPGGIGAEAEEGGVAERDDAGIAEDQVEREREQRQDRDLVEEQRACDGSRKRGEGHEPRTAAPKLGAARGASALRGCRTGLAGAVGVIAARPRRTARRAARAAATTIRT